jgi:hypothetical protein
MKKSLLALSFLPLFSFAQMTEANDPAIGATATLYLCDSNTVLYENVTGTGVTWDYSNLLGVQELTKTLSVEAVDPLTVDSIFVGATKKYSIDNLLTTYYSSSSSERTSQGNIFSEPSLGEVFVNWNLDNQKLNNYPFALNDELNDAIDGGIISANPLVPIDTVANGGSYSTIDGVGTLKLQQNDYTNVIRYYITDTLNTVIFNAIFGEQPITLIREWYEYYDYTTSNLPIFVVVSIKLTSALINNESTLVLSKDMPNDYIGLAENNIGTFDLYPNPADQVLNINTEGDFNYSVMNVNGEVLVKNTNSKTLDISSFSAGIYFVKLQNAKGVQVKKFVTK